MKLSPRTKLNRVVQRALRKRGYGVYRLSDDERAMFERDEQRNSRDSLNDTFGASLRRLQDLRTRYAAVDLPVAIHSLWATRNSSRHIADIGWGGVDLRNFRGHSAYVWDYGSANYEASRLRYFLFADAVRQKDRLGLLAKMTEDGAFGCTTFEFAGLNRVSRDLLDSVVEINFLDAHLGLMDRDDVRVLDIGAGYGRMAHRMLEVHPGIQTYTCVDAVPESTFLSEFYLKHRGLENRVEVVPLDQLENHLQPNRSYDLAINIHSFSECTYAAIEWWLRRLKDIGVRHLLIVPNDPTRLLSIEADGSHRDYEPLLAQLGFGRMAQEPVFDDSQVQELIGVRDNMFLFELR